MTWRSICRREKGRTSRFLPCIWIPRADLCEQQALSLSLMSPFQAELGSWMQRGRGRDMGYRATATVVPLAGACSFSSQTMIGPNYWLPFSPFLSVFLNFRK